MRSQLVKISSLWLLILWLMAMLGCGSSMPPPAPQVAQLALVANLDANSLPPSTWIQSPTNWRA